MPRAQTVVIGVGNPLRGDDGAGPAVVRALRAAGVPEGVGLFEAEAGAVDIMELWEGAHLAIVVDAVRSGATPGSIHRLELPGGTATSRRSSHGLELDEAAGIAQALGRLPARLVTFGVEVKACELGAPLSIPVARAVRSVAGEIAGLLLRPPSRKGLATVVHQALPRQVPRV